MSPSTPDRLADAARLALASAEQVLRDEATADVPDAAVQQLLTAGLRLYARKVETEARNFPPLAPDAATATDVAVLVTELLRVVNLNLFDLSMWAGRPRYDAALPEPAP